MEGPSVAPVPQPASKAAAKVAPVKPVPVASVPPVPAAVPAKSTTVAPVPPATPAIPVPVPQKQPEPKVPVKAEVQVPKPVPGAAEENKNKPGITKKEPEKLPVSAKAPAEPVSPPAKPLVEPAPTPVAAKEPSTVPDKVLHAEDSSKITPKPLPPPMAAASEVKKALPVETDTPQTLMDFALWQIALERRNFSCGTIDGSFAMRSTRAIREFQANQGLPRTGILDDATRLKLSKPGDPYLSYTVTVADMSKVDPTPKTFVEKAKKNYLGYNDAWEMLGEKFHSGPDFLKKMNPGVTVVQAGTVLTAPNLGTSTPLPKAAKINIRLSETTLTVRDASGRVIACFPCSIAKDKNKRPSGQLLVAVVVPDPNYTFNPDVLKEAAQKEGITKKLILPPGPNNPVGMAWIGLSLPGYGIHGTPEPSAISRTGSMGCFRLANWNAQKLLRMVSPGVPVEVEE